MPRAPAPASLAQGDPRVRRGYFECRHGQLHVHYAIPPGGGFEEGTTLLCLHRPPLSARMFRAFLPLAGRDRSVYAPDLPGYGGSDAPAAQLTIAGYAEAIGDFLDSMRLKQVDVLGCHAGALVAAELAVTRPTVVRRLVLASVPAHAPEEAEGLRRSPWPAPPAEDGSHLAVEWRRALEARVPGVTVEQLASGVADALQSGGCGWWAVEAALAYPAPERLRLVTQPALLLRPRDDTWDCAPRAREALLRATVVELRDCGQHLFEAHALKVADAVRDFLRD
jgi:pimeloyl-ACP methyl ester carboxylesterase